jgi:hypothetical protein
MEARSVKLDYALAVMALPRQLGDHPELGDVVEVRNGKFGPFVQHADTKRSVPKVTLRRRRLVPMRGLKQPYPALRALPDIYLPGSSAHGMRPPPVSPFARRTAEHGPDPDVAGGRGGPAKDR